MPKGSHATERRLEEGLPTLVWVLRTYFAPDPPRDHELLLDWQASGGDGPNSSSRFRGLSADLDAGIERPDAACTVLNETLTLTPPWSAEQTRDILVDLSDQLHQRGPYAAATKVAAMSESQRFDAWARRRTPLPASLSHIDIPLWQTAVGAAALGSGTALIAQYVPWLALPAGIITLITLLVLAYAIAAMLILRDQVTNPHREEVRRRRTREAQRRREERRASGGFFSRRT